MISQSVNQRCLPFPVFRSASLGREVPASTISPAAFHSAFDSVGHRIEYGSDLTYPSAVLCWLLDVFSVDAWQAVGFVSQPTESPLRAAGREIRSSSQSVFNTAARDGQTVQLTPAGKIGGLRIAALHNQLVGSCHHSLMLNSRPNRE